MMNRVASSISEIFTISTLVLLPTAANAAVTSFTSQAAFADAAPGVVVETFESFDLGNVSAVPSLSIASMSGFNYSGTRRRQRQFIGSSTSLPFPMFVPPLPSGTKFLSNNLAFPTYGTGGIEFNFSSPQFAVGAFIASSSSVSPVGNFSIEVFFKKTALGSITVRPGVLPDSFVGIVSTEGFNRARFIPAFGRSWGLDNLQAAAVPEPAGYLMLSFGSLALWLATRKRMERAWRNAAFYLPSDRSPDSQ